MVLNTDFDLSRWDEVRSFGVQPRYHSGYAADEVQRREFLTGARLMGFELEDFDPEKRLRELTDPIVAAQERKRRRDAGYFEQLMPQQLAIADTMHQHHDTNVFEISRRASKTTSLFFVFLGRAACRPGYQATFSAQNGVMGSRRLREWANRMDVVTPDTDTRPPWLRGASGKPSRHLALFGEELVPEFRGDEGRPFRIMRGEVGKGIYFTNGAQFLVLKPEADAYRGEGADDSWLDEFQEVEAVDGDDLLAAILPLQDTKIGAATTVSGTTGPARIGPFWKMVDQLRSDDPDIGGMDYAADPDTDWDVIENEEQALALLAEVHPGVGTLTTIDKMRKNYRKLAKPQWAMEYLSIWPEAFGVQAIPADWIERAKRKSWAKRPARVAFAYDIRPGGGVACLAAAWRDSSGVAYVEVIKHALGTSWLPELAQDVNSKFRGSTVAYDDIAEGGATAVEMQRLRPQPRLQKQLYREHAAGCVQLLRDLERGQLRIAQEQVMLTTAMSVAVKREVRGDNGVWMWGAPPEGGDITPLVAGTRALRNWDQHFDRPATATRPIMGD